jgi:hypothetical protein
MKQLYLSGFGHLNVKAFGGSLTARNAREQRPVSSKRAMHLVLRSSLATGQHSLLRYAQPIEALTRRLAAAKGVRVYRYANAGNHLHLIILPRDRIAYRAFIRSVTGLIARSVLHAERGRARGVQFWDALPFTLIIEWGKQFRAAISYLLRNELEARRLIPYRRRRGKPP